MFRADQPVFLIGFMASGKTTLAEMWAKRSLDLDRYIEHRVELPIAQIFDCYGESYFRWIEAQLLRCLDGPKTIIAVGGGCPMHYGNMAWMKSRGRVIYLKWPFEHLYRRIVSDPNRPLARGGDFESLKALFLKRVAVYEQADLVVEMQEGDFSMLRLLE